MGFGVDYHSISFRDVCFRCAQQRGVLKTQQPAFLQIENKYVLWILHTYRILHLGITKCFTMPSGYYLFLFLGRIKWKGERETRVHMQHPHVVLIEIAVLKCIWLYATCVEQQRTCFFYRLMRYSLYFWMSGRAFLVSWVLKAQSRWKSWRVRDTRNLRTMPLQQGTSLSGLAARVHWLMTGVCSQWQSWERSAGVQFPGHAVPEQNVLVPNA